LAIPTGSDDVWGDMRAIGSLAGLALILGLASLVSGATSAATADVLVQNFSFQPSAVSIVAGGSVTWTGGTDPEQHTVTPREPSAFDGSGDLFTGDTFTVTFDEPGAVEYFCSLHPTMVGTVEVSASVETATPAAVSPPAPTASAGGGVPRPAGETASDPTLLVVAAIVGLGVVVLLAFIARRRA
jgi:plastocyanin